MQGQKNHHRKLSSRGSRKGHCCNNLRRESFGRAVKAMQSPVCRWNRDRCMRLEEEMHPAIGVTVSHCVPFGDVGSILEVNEQFAIKLACSAIGFIKGVQRTQ